MKKAFLFLCSVLAGSSAGWAEPKLKLAPIHLSAAPDQAVRQVLEDVKNPVFLVLVTEQPAAAPAPAPPAPPPRSKVPLPPGSEVPEEDDEGGSVVPVDRVDLVKEPRSGVLPTLFLIAGPIRPG